MELSVIYFFNHNSGIIHPGNTPGGPSEAPLAARVMDAGGRTTETSQAFVGLQLKPAAADWQRKMLRQPLASGSYAVTTVAVTTERTGRATGQNAGVEPRRKNKCSFLRETNHECPIFKCRGV